MGTLSFAYVLCRHSVSTCSLLKLIAQKAELEWANSIRPHHLPRLTWATLCQMKGECEVYEQRLVAKHKAARGGATHSTATGKVAKKQSAKKEVKKREKGKKSGGGQSGSAPSGSKQ